MAWLHLIVLGLNRTYGLGRHKKNEKVFLWAQQSCLNRLYDQVALFLTRNGERMIGKGWANYMENRNVSYDGEEVFAAEALTWDRVEPALPPLGCGGIIDATSVCEEAVGALLQHPEKLLKPRALWKEKRKNARAWCTDDEWEVIAPALVNRGLLQLSLKKAFIKLTGSQCYMGYSALQKVGTKRAQALCD